MTGIAGTSGGGYLVLTSYGGVSNFGAPWYGSDTGKLPAGVTAVALAADPVTGGYWILTTAGGVDAYGAPAYGTLTGQIPAGQAVTAITSG